MLRPFFHADQVGSLLRPSKLLAARKRWKAGEIDHKALRSVEDEAIAEAVRLQEALGLRVVTDGEYRRENWWVDFICRIDGVEIRDGDSSTTAFVQDHGERYIPKRVMTVSTLGHRAPIYADDFAYLQSVATRTPKITLPSPTRMHFHGGRKNISPSAYPDTDRFFADIAKVYQEEISALEEAGCRYIQIDDPLLTYFIGDKLREEARSNGEDPEERLERYVRLLNDCIAQRKADTAVGIHLCRGNAKSAWIAEGGYERIAEKVLGGLHVDHFLLEYDDERSGDFHPLRYVPKGKRVVLGLITTKHGRLEEVDTLKRRIDDASRYVAIEDLGISPQCGFASVVEGNIITEEQQLQKLRLVVNTSLSVWGKA